MRAFVISDIHRVPMDIYRGPVGIPEADICICAGDITDNVYATIVYVLAEIASKMPVVVVLGNHDYYSTSIDRALEIARKRFAGTNVHLLENDTVEVLGVRFIGATLWTDFEIPHGMPDGMDELAVDERRDLAFHVCIRDIADFRHIYRSDVRRPGETGFVTIQELIARHRESRAYIERRLDDAFDGPTVVLTHHAPSPRSIHPAYIGAPSNAAFASDLTNTIDIGRPTYWIHGHIHHASDYVEGETRVLCNPRGYRHELPSTGFRSGLLVEI
jgi:Icc-related predicted phosphoesterase